MNDTLKIIFDDKNDFNDAVYEFKYESDFNINTSDNDEMSITLNVNDARDAMYDVDEILNSIGISGYHFDENMMESKKAKVKTLIERIVERVIAKKLNESKRSKRSLRESKYDYFKTVKDYASNQLADFFRVNVSSLQRFNFDGNDDIAQLSKALNSTSDEGTKLYYNAAIKSAKRELDIDESVKPKRRLKESEEAFTVQDLEDHIYNNISEIKREMEDYGWEIDDIGKMRNYIDFANLLNIDSRKVKDVELKMYAEMAMDIIRQNIDEVEDDY